MRLPIFPEGAHKTIHLLSINFGQLAILELHAIFGSFLISVFCSIVPSTLPHTSLNSVTLYDFAFNKATSPIDHV